MGVLMTHLGELGIYWWPTRIANQFRLCCAVEGMQWMTLISYPPVIEWDVKRAETSNKSFLLDAAVDGNDDGDGHEDHSSSCCLLRLCWRTLCNGARQICHRLLRLLSGHRVWYGYSHWASGSEWMHWHTTRIVTTPAKHHQSSGPLRIYLFIYCVAWYVYRMRIFLSNI